jgi:hypothetical protein
VEETEEMATSDWAARLDEGDFSGARAEWQERFGAGSESLDASWALAEVEERWGDELFFAVEAGAAGHYHAAQRALAPPGTQFSSGEENDRRMEAYARVTEKLYAVDPYGRAREGHGGRPHPNSQRTLPRVAPALPSIPVRPALRTSQPTEFAKLFQGGDHWRYHELGNQWRDAGQALAGSYPDGARRAYAWSLHYFELYNQAWSAHLPASRWDSDGGEEMVEVQDLMQGLAASSAGARLPAWVEALLAGEWRQALSALGDHPPEALFQPIAVLLAEACRAGSDR